MDKTMSIGAILFGVYCVSSDMGNTGAFMIFLGCLGLKFLK